MDDNKRILLTLTPEDWRRPQGRPHITWLSIIQQDLRSQNLTLPKTMDMAQNRCLWRMWSTYGDTQSWVACQKWRRRRTCQSAKHVPVYCWNNEGNQSVLAHRRFQVSFQSTPFKKCRFTGLHRCWMREFPCADPPRGTTEWDLQL